MSARYDTIGLNYTDLRRPDIRIARRIDDALGEAGTVLNVGAGAGSYEPAGRQVTAVDPSAEMIRRRPASDVNVIQYSAEDLPFEDNSFDAAMAVLTIHHWSDQEAGAREIRRVTRGRIVFLTYDASFRGFWLADYFPALVTLDEGQMPPLSRYSEWLGPVKVSAVRYRMIAATAFSQPTGGALRPISTSAYVLRCRPSGRWAMYRPASRG